MTLQSAVLAAVCACLLPTLLESPVQAADALEFIGQRSELRGSDAVIAPSGAALVQTAQLLPADSTGKLQGTTPEEQTETVIKQLEQVLAAADSRLEQLVRVHLYVADSKVAQPVLNALTAALPEGAAPALTLVETRLPLEGAVVALDAIALADADNPAAAPVVRRSVRGIAGWPEQTHVVNWQSPRVVFISGQAERADSAAESAKLTMASLHRTLDFLGLTAGDVVQVKTFVTPMAEANQVHQQIATFYGRNQQPAISHVEWNSTLPIEIEMIAIAPAAENTNDAPVVEWRTPPGMSTSPVFSRLAVARNDGLIFTSSLYGPAGAAAKEEVAGIFGHLENVLKESGSSYDQLVKATYYVANDEVSNALNALRPEKYHPERPPAASKAAVSGVGLTGRGINIDMIAVRARKK